MSSIAKYAKPKIGQKYGRLTVVDDGSPAAYGGRDYTCLCECGKTVLVRMGNLRTGKTKSCGCLHVDTSRALKLQHGASGTGTYNTWKSMIARCLHEAHDAYPLYGGAGITVCDKWLEYEGFLEDMGQRPSGLTLDRIDGSLGYFPGNCRWATKKEQANNRSNNRVLSANGESKTVSEWAESIGVPTGVLLMRLDRGIPIEAAIVMPYKKTIFVKYQGKEVNLAELARLTGKPYTTIVRRYKDGKTEKELWS